MHSLNHWHSFTMYRYIGNGKLIRYSFYSFYIVALNFDCVFLQILFYHFFLIKLENQTTLITQPCSNLYNYMILFLFYKKSRTTTNYDIWISSFLLNIVFIHDYYHVVNILGEIEILVGNICCCCLSVVIVNRCFTCA